MATAYQDFFGTPPPTAKAPTNKKGQEIPVSKPTGKAVESFFSLPIPKEKQIQPRGAPSSTPYVVPLPGSDHAFNPRNPYGQQNLDSITRGVSNPYLEPTTYLDAAAKTVGAPFSLAMKGTDIASKSLQSGGKFFGTQLSEAIKPGVTKGQAQKPIFDQLKTNYKSSKGVTDIIDEILTKPIEKNETYNKQLLKAYQVATDKNASFGDKAVNFVREIALGLPAGLGGAAHTVASGALLEGATGGIMATANKFYYKVEPKAVIYPNGRITAGSKQTSGSFSDSVSSLNPIKNEAKVLERPDGSMAQLVPTKEGAIIVNKITQRFGGKTTPDTSAIPYQGASSAQAQPETLSLGLVKEAMKRGAYEDAQAIINQLPANTTKSAAQSLLDSYRGGTQPSTVVGFRDNLGQVVVLPKVSPSTVPAIPATTPVSVAGIAASAAASSLPPTRAVPAQATPTTLKQVLNPTPRSTPAPQKTPANTLRERLQQEAPPQKAAPAATTPTYNPDTLSKIATNSLFNNPANKFNKPNRLNGEGYSYKEAETGLTETGKDLPGRIVFGKNDSGQIVLKDGTHLLEAYRDMGIDVPEVKIKLEDGLKLSDIGKPPVLKAGKVTDTVASGGDIQFIREATPAEVKSPAAKNLAFQSIPAKEGFEAVFKPYGEQGRGFYYAKVAKPKPAPTLSSFVSRKELNQIRTESMKFPDTEMESNYQKFSKRYGHFTVNNPADASAFKKVVPESERWFRSRDYGDEEVFELFKERYEGKSTTLYSSMIPGLPQFIEQDVKPGTVAFARGAVQTFKDARNLIAPRMGASKKSLDAFMVMKGERDKAEFIMQQTLETAKAMFDKLPQEKLIEFFDRYKTGQKQETPELQAYADFRRDFDKQIYDEIEAVKPTAAWIDDHMRVLWKVIPGAPTGTREQIFGSKRPLQGSKGFLKQHTLPDMSTGLEMGGVPYTYNPAQMDNLAWSDAIRYVSAQKMWKKLGETGSRQYLGSGKSIPLGKALVNDRIAQMMGGGRWVLDEGDARLLNNMLSADYIRRTALGRGAFITKNIYTAVELSLSGFHAIFVSADTISSQMSLGILRIFNQGIKRSLGGVIHGNTAELLSGIKALAGGVKDIVTSPIAPFTNARLGATAKRSIAGKPNIMHGKDLAAARAEFDQSPMGKMLNKKYANAPELIDLLFNGGLKPKMDASYRTNTIDTFTAAIRQGNYIGGLLRAIPALNQTIMTPLFEWYIPNLKWGVAMRALVYELELNATRIANGKITKEEIARDVVNRTENRLGEMNFDNLFWNNTFKSTMQLAIRSITWTGGSVREIAGAPYEQAREFYNAYKEKRAPNMTPKVAYIFALLFFSAVLAEVIQYLSTGKHINPLSKDLAYPKINEDGDRVSVPTYIKDIFAAKAKPLEFARNKVSGLWGKLIEDLQNKDFYSNEVYKESDPVWLKFTKSMWHLKPVPFSVSSALRQETTASKVESFAGISKAPRYIDNTPIQNKIYELYNRRFGGGVKSEEQTKKADTSSEYKRLVREGRTQEAADVKAKAIADGIFTERGFGRIETNLKKGTDKILFDRLPQDDKDTLIKEMSPAEKDYYTSKSSTAPTKRTRTTRSSRTTRSTR